MRNIILLIRKFFVENWKKETITFAAYFLLLFLCGNFANGVLILMGICAVVATMIIKTTTAFSILGTKESSISYLTLPASSGQKIISSIFISQVYQTLAFILVTVLGLYIGYICPGLFEKSSVESINWSYGFFVKNAFVLLSIIVFLQSICFFASVYFRRLSFLKLSLTVVIIVTFFVLLNIVMFVIGFHCIEIPEGTYMFNEVNSIRDFLSIGLGKNLFQLLEFLVKNIKGFVIFICFNLSVGFWALSYLRLKETEV